MSNEAAIQRAIVAYLRTVMPADNVVHHSANEGVRGGKAGAIDGKRKREMGQAAGFPDLVVLTYRGALFFEVKAESGRLSKAQKDMHAKLAAMGYRVAVVRSVDDVRETLREWSFPTREAEP